MLKKFKPALVLCLAVMLACVMSTPMIASAAAKAVKVKATRTSGSTEQMTVKGLTKSNKVVWKYTTKKYSAVELNRTKCKVHGTKVYIFDGSSLRIVKKSTGAKVSVTKDITSAGHVVGFDASGNIYVTGYYDTVLYKIAPKGGMLWKSDYSNTGKEWAKKITATATTVTVTCDSSDSNPGESGNYKVVFSADTGIIQ